MIPWIISEKIQSSLTHPSYRGSIHPHFHLVSELRQKGFGEPLLCVVSHEAFKAFLAHANLSLESLTPDNYQQFYEGMSKTALPEKLIQTIKHCLDELRPTPSTFHLELFLNAPFDFTIDLDESEFFEGAAASADEVPDVVKAAWLSLFQPGVFAKLQKLGLSLSDISVCLNIRREQIELRRAKAFSAAWNQPWEQRFLIVVFQSQSAQLSFQIDRQSMEIMFLGKNRGIPGENLLEGNEFSPSDLNQLPEISVIKKVAQCLMAYEQKLGCSLRLDVSVQEDKEILIRRMNILHRATPYRNRDKETKLLDQNIWDQTFLPWNSDQLLEPLWFSLLTRTFKGLSAHYCRWLGLKRPLYASYERVWRNFWGLLRGRPYINLAALHRCLALGHHSHLSRELEAFLEQWTTTFGHDARPGNVWQQQWPVVPSLNGKEIKIKEKKQQVASENMASKLKDWKQTLGDTIDKLAISHWQNKNLSSMIEGYLGWEEEFVAGLVPLLLLELRYWELKSWYQHDLTHPEPTPSWHSEGQHQDKELSGNWLSRRRKKNKIVEFERLGKLREEYRPVLTEIIDKLKFFFELMGTKFKDFRQIEHSEDIFLLSFDEILAIEEGRTICSHWRRLVDIRRQENAIFAADLNFPLIWLTEGPVGIAARYPELGAIKSFQKPVHTQASASTSSATTAPTTFATSTSRASRSHQREELSFSP